jgi:hypothetical protein
MVLQAWDVIHARYSRLRAWSRQSRDSRRMEATVPHSPRRMVSYLITM